MVKQLNVYMNGIHAGYLIDVGNAQIEFIYTKDYAASNQLPISNSLPTRDLAFSDTQCRAFFSGLLPDDQKLDSLARQLQVSKNNVFKLLAEVGEECAGAVALSAKEMNFNNQEPLRNIPLKEFAQIVQTANTKTLMGSNENIRLSLAGAQSKFALVMQDGAFFHSSGNVPSSHIIKPPSKTIQGIVENEFYCMQLAQQVDINVPKSEIIEVGNDLVYCIERYDRSIKNKAIERIHQEDFCQALSISPENKYESEGGPSLQQCIDLIMTCSNTPAIDYQQMLKRVIFNYLIGNNDAHGKNFSLVYITEKNQVKNIKLAPAYDLLSTVVYPELSTKMAMKIGGRYKPEDLQKRHWERLVHDTNSAKRNLKKQIVHVCNKLYIANKNQFIRTRKSAYHHPIINEIYELIEIRIKRLMKVFDASLV